MARKLSVEFEGAIYHVTLRGVERRRLFDDDRDRERFLSQLAGGVEPDGVRLYLFCLMVNPVHGVVETPRANLGRFLHRLQTGYTVYDNLRRGRAGHLMQGRDQATPVEGDEYILNLTRAIPADRALRRRVHRIQGELQQRLDGVNAQDLSYKG